MLLRRVVGWAGAQMFGCITISVALALYNCLLLSPGDACMRERGRQGHRVHDAQTCVYVCATERFVCRSLASD